MTNLQYTVLPLTNDPYQVFTLDTTIDGEPFRARFEVRYLSAPEAWVISLWDHATEEQLAGPIPLVASFGQVNDLFRPFRHLREGKGIGSLMCLSADSSESSDGAGNPGPENLTEYKTLFGDTYE